jgi:hypothetical protein
MTESSWPEAALLRVLCLCGVAAAIAGTAEAQDLELELRLSDAVVSGGADGPARTYTLMVPLRRSGSNWERFVAYAGGGPRTVHGGRVDDGQAEDGSIRLVLAMEVAGDYGSSVRGRAKYEVNLRRQADGRFAGEHAGTWRGSAVKGKAEATVPPPRCKTAGHVPVRMGEHPRIMFRKGDLEALRKRAATPFGKDALAAMGGPAGMGLKFQLTGEKRWADEAAQAVVPLMAKGLHSDKSRGLSERANEIAIAYDCCYDAWPEDLKRLVEDYLVRAIRCAFGYHEDFIGSGINWHVCSNWSAPLYTAVAFGGLALWGEKGPEPARPQPPAAEIEIPTAAGYAPGEGVPVVPAASAGRIRQWLATEPVDLYVEQEPADLGGWAGARPKPGTKFRCGLRDVTFRALPAEMVSPEGALLMPRYLPAPKGDMSLATVYLYTVLKCDAPGLWKVDCPVGDVTKPKIFLAGRQAAHGDLVKLPQGHLPLLVVYLSAARAHVPWKAFEIGLLPATPADRDAAKAALALRQADYQESLKDWEYDAAEWKRTGGMNVEYLKGFLKSRTAVYMHYREAVGTGGFQAEVGGYSGNATGPAAKYAVAYRNVFGEDLSPYEDIAAFVPRKVFAHHLPPEGQSRGKPIAQDINGSPSLVGLPALFPVIRDEWRPAVLWFWNCLNGDRAEQAAIGADPAGAFLYYPLDLAPKHPRGVMPLAWQAPDFGFYGFRNGWGGKDDFIIQAFMKAHHIRGWNGANAGTFRVFGLGQPWACGTDKRERCRAIENVVQLPEDTINDGACGKVVFARVEPDGSGVVTVNLDDVYATRDADAREMYEYYGNGRIAPAFKDSGIRGVRSFAVDYSGKSGAPCLMAIVDVISGGRSKVWTWQLPDLTGAKGQAAQVGTATDGGFLVKGADGASMRGTFLSPAKAQVKVERRSGTFDNAHSGQVKYDFPGVFASGADPRDGNFFVVVTFQRGDGPEVKVEGSGPGATARVGKRTVRFDGEKIVLGE